MDYTCGPALVNIMAMGMMVVSIIVSGTVAGTAAGIDPVVVSVIVAPVVRAVVTVVITMPIPITVSCWSPPGCIVIWTPVIGVSNPSVAYTS